MSKLFLIGDEDTVIGFRFAGIRGYVARSPTEAGGLFRKASEDRNVTIVVITEQLAEGIRPELDRYTEKHPLPFVVEIPDSSGPSPRRKSPSQIIRETIGISI